MLKKNSIPLKGFHFYLSYQYLQDIIENINLRPIIFEDYIPKNSFDNLDLLIKQFQEKIKKNQKDPTSHYLLGLSYIYLKKYKESLEEFKLAYQLKKDYFEAYLYSSRVLYFLKDWKSLDKVLFDALKIQSRNFELLFYTGHSAFEQGLFKKAIQAFKEAKKYQPFDYKTQYNLAGVYYRLKKYKKAFLEYKKAFQMQSKNQKDDLFFYTANCLFRQKQFKRALRFYKKADSSYHRNYNMAYSFYKLKKYKKALTYYEMALKENPLKENHLNGLGILLSERKNFKKAEEQFQKALALNEYSFELWNNLAINQGYLTYYSQAEKAYLKALEIKTDSRVQINYAAFLIEKGSYQKAFKILMDLLKKGYKKNFQLYNNLAAIYVNKKKYFLAIKMLKKLSLYKDENDSFIDQNWELLLKEVYGYYHQNIPSDYLDEMLSFLQFLFKKEKWQKFINLYEWIQSLNRKGLPFNLPNKDLAEAYYRLKKYDTAISFYKKTLAEDKTLLSNFLYFHMGLAYLKVKNYHEAEDIFENLLETQYKQKKNISFFLAKIAFHKKDYSKALKYFQEAFKIVPKKYKNIALFQIAKVYYALKKWHLSVLYIKKLLKKEDYPNQIYYYLALNFFSLRKWEKAIKYANLAKNYIKKDLQEARMNFIKANALMEKGNYKKAQILFEQLYALYPEWNRLLYKAALNLIMIKNYPQAELFIQKILERKKDHVLSYLQMVRLCFYQNDYQKALEFILPIESSKKFRPHLLYYSSICFFKLKDYSKTILQMNEFFNLEKNESSKHFFSINKERNGYFLLAQAYKKIGEKTKSLDFLKKSVNTQESFFNLFLLAKTLFLEKEWDAAQFYFRKLIHYQEKIALVYFYLGKILLEKKIYQAAISYFQKSIAKSFGFTQAHYSLALCFYKERNYSKSIQILKEFLKIYPNHLKSYILLAKNFYASQRIQESIESFEKAHSLGMRTSGLYKNWASLLMKEKLYEKALEKYQFTLNLNKKNKISIYYKQIKALIYLQRYQEALTIIQQIKEVKIQKDSFYFYYGQILFFLKKFKKSLSYFKKSLLKGRKNTKKYLFLGHSYFGLKIYLEALKAYRRVAFLSPQDYLNHFYLGKTYFKLEKYSQSIKYLELLILNLKNKMSHLEQEEYAPFRKIISKSFLLLSFAYEKIQNYNLAFEYLENWLKSKDHRKLSLKILLKVIEKMEFLFIKNQETLLKIKYQEQQDILIRSYESFFWKEKSWILFFQKELKSFLIDLRKESLNAFPEIPLSENAFFNHLQKSFNNKVNILSHKKDLIEKFSSKMKSRFLKTKVPQSGKMTSWLESKINFLKMNKSSQIQKNLILKRNYHSDFDLKDYQKKDFYIIQVVLECIFETVSSNMNLENTLMIFLFKKQENNHFLFQHIVKEELSQRLKNRRKVKKILEKTSLNLYVKMGLIKKYLENSKIKFKVSYKKDKLQWHLIKKI